MPADSQPYDLSELKALADSGRWGSVLEITTNVVNHPDARASSDIVILLFHGWALFHCGHFAESKQYCLMGLNIDISDRWGRQLLFESRLALGEIDDAFADFQNFIEANTDVEAEKAWLVEKAVTFEKIHLAENVNNTRLVISDHVINKPFALVVQCFIKSDALALVIERLKALLSKDRYALVFIIDTPRQAAPMNVIDGHEKVCKLIREQTHSLASHFDAIEVIINKQNLGTAATCRRVLDFVCSRYKGFLFIEDDCLLSKSALDWATFNLEENLRSNDAWFFSCESTFFNSEGRTLNDDLQCRFEKVSRSVRLQHSYYYLKFVPSTCFGTRSEIWRECSNVRSFTRGPESLTLYVNKRGKKVIAPTVPRASDIGMQHELGYSVTMLGVSGVIEKKTTYLLADEFIPLKTSFLDLNQDELYAATVSLDQQTLVSLEEVLFASVSE